MYPYTASGCTDKKSLKSSALPVNSSSASSNNSQSPVACLIDSFREQQLTSLLNQCRKLREENHSPQNRQESLVAERASLVAKNEEARTKVEAMINRLKALEQS